MKIAAFPILLALAACHFGLPDERAAVANPSFAKDVLPIFNDHCTLCHGTPVNRGAPNYFRLDAYGDTSAQDGAGTMAPLVQKHINEGSMPPAARWGDGLGDNDKQTVNNWVNNGAPP